MVFSSRVRLSESLAGQDAEWDDLAAALAAYGVRHLAAGRSATPDLPTGAELFRRLFTSTNVRLQEASIVLLLTHPQLTGAAREAVGRLSGAQRDRAVRRCVAAAALQHMWRTRLELALGPQPLIEPEYLRELGLPDLDEDFGQRTLWELSAQEEALYGYNAWAGYTSLMDLVLGQAQLPGWGQQSA